MVDLGLVTIGVSNERGGPLNKVGVDSALLIRCCLSSGEPMVTGKSLVLRGGPLATVTVGEDDKTSLDKAALLGAILLCGPTTGDPIGGRPLFKLGDPTTIPPAGVVSGRLGGRAATE